MASKFSSAEYICEGDDCKAITGVTYYVNKKKKLCDDCAAQEGCIRKAIKGGPNLYCEKHDKDIDLYCKTHSVALCLVCASIDHNQQPCVRQDLEGAIMEIKTKLNGLKEKAMVKLQLCRVYGDQIRQCRQDTDKHLQAIKCEFDSVINEAIKKDEDREQEDAAKINQETDAKNHKLQKEVQKINDKMQNNNEEREGRLELNHQNAEKRRVPINNKQRGIHSDIEVIAEVTERKIDESEKSWKDDTKTAENTVQTLDTVLKDDKNVAKDGYRVNASVTDELEKGLDVDGAKHITRTVSGVRFLKGAGREKYNGKIDGYDGEWKLIDTINVNDEFLYTKTVGCKDDCNVMITGEREDDTYDTYILDMNTKHIQIVITCTDNSCVMSSVILNSDKVVCGKYHIDCTGDSLTGCISVYDSQWNLIKDVTIPRNTEGDETRVDVAADQDGMIIVAESGQSKIYVINPADGKITHTITCQEDMIMRGVLSSGHIIAQPYPADQRMFIIDREGAHREIFHSDAILAVCIDPMTDDLYIVSSDYEYKTYVIDQVMRGVDMCIRRVASFPLSTSLTEEVDRAAHLGGSQVVITSSGNMIACDGDSILVFKKLFSL